MKICHNINVELQNFPEVVLVDATYQTNNLRYTCYTFLVIDGNGQSEVIASFLVTSEDAPMIQNMVTIFKDNNPNWTDIQVVLTDKDMVESGVFRQELPNADLQICLFHVIRSMKRPWHSWNSN